MENLNKPAPTPAQTPIPTSTPSIQNSVINDDQNIVSSDPDLSFGSVPDLSKVVMTQSLPEIEVFVHINFNFQTTTIELHQEEKERHPRRDRLRTTFDVNLKGHPLDKNISSVIVYSGYWQFSDSEGVALPPILGPGHYASVEAFKIPNDRISSFKCIGVS